MSGTFLQDDGRSGRFTIELAPGTGEVAGDDTIKLDAVKPDSRDVRIVGVGGRGACCP